MPNDDSFKFKPVPFKETSIQPVKRRLEKLNVGETRVKEVVNKAVREDPVGEEAMSPEPP